MSKYLMNHRFLGVVFVGMLVLSVWLVSAVFSQKFVSFDEVKLKSSSTGLQLPSKADVKIRGVIIGQVNKVVSDGDKGVVLTLGIKPDAMKEIPRNVSASILPKTLFGEKFVQLDYPKDPDGSSLQSGATISQTKIPIEVERVLNDLYPLLRTVQPAELNYTLNALADALEGRGNKLGESLVTLNSYLTRMNPQVPALIDDLKLLARVTDTYADVTPALAATLRNTVKTGNTLRSKEATLKAFLDDLTSFSDTTTAFLNDNGDNLIKLGKLGEPILGLLSRYSPSIACTLDGIVKQAPRLGSTFRGFVFHIDLVTLPQQPRGYTGGDTPKYGADNGPTCAGLPNPPIPYGAHNEFPNIDDGVNNINKGDNQRTLTGFGASRRFKATTSTRDNGTVVAGTADQKDLVNALTAPVLGIPVTQMSDAAALLFTPAISGSQVSVR